MAHVLRIKIENPPESAAVSGSNRMRFWSAVALRAQYSGQPRHPSWQDFIRDAAFALRFADADRSEELRSHCEEMEGRVKERFAETLRSSVIIEIHQRKPDVFDAVNIRFMFAGLDYGSLEVLLAAIGIEKTAAIYTLALPVMMSIIKNSVPEALRDTVGLPNDIDFDVTMTDEDGPPTSAAENQAQTTSDAQPSRMAAVSKALSLLSVSYLGPILLGIVVLYFASAAAFDAIKTADTERITLMQGYADITKQQLMAFSDERKEMAKAAQEATRAASAERAALVQAYADLTKQQVTALSDERKEIEKIAGTLLHDADADRLKLVETLRRVTTDEHGQSLEILRPATDKGRETEQSRR